MSSMSRSKSGRNGHHVDTTNGSVKCTNRVLSYAVESSPKSLGEQLPFTSISIEHKVIHINDCDPAVDNILKSEESTPC